ncbi:hypothetical protein AK830_g3497 [Neonectria ditissima]|uniref:Uncharacterized protein n=1 Tax=Neonectria ditissima TaxID=78410 RepID=A0A0N8H7X4_9HYPO|nr:hypothetical protein AK830_g3497 [Neonectria ditissima]
MARLPSITRRRLLGLARAAAGISATGTAGFWFWTRKCQFEDFSPETDKLFHHPLLKQINPGNNPESHDMCVRRVPFSQLKPELLQDAQRGGSKLVEAYSAGMWGRYAYAIQRKIMESFRDDSNRDDVWAKEDLLRSTYEPDPPLSNDARLLLAAAKPTGAGLGGQPGGAPSGPGPRKPGRGIQTEDDYL